MQMNIFEGEINKRKVLTEYFPFFISPKIYLFFCNDEEIYSKQLLPFSDTESYFSFNFFCFCFQIPITHCKEPL